MILIRFLQLRWFFGLAIILVFASENPTAASVWIHLVSGNASGAWGTAANWSGGVPNATDAIADFSALNLGFNSTINNDAVRTVGTLLFNDTTAGNNWTLSGSKLTLATSSGAPMINVISSSQTTTMSAGLDGSQGFVKSGAGTLLLSGGTANTIGGTIVITNGSIQTPNGASLKNVTATIVVATGAALRVAGAFDNNANSCPLVLNGTGHGNGSEGVLHGYYNQTMNGAITLNSDSKISHDWNLFTLNGPITAASGSNDLEMAITVAGQATLAANGNVNLGLGTLTVSSVTGGAAVTLGGSNTLGGVVVQPNGTLLFGSVNAIGGSGPMVTINDGGTAALSGTDLNPLLARVETISAGAIAFNGASSSTALNFGNYTNLSLGSVGNSSYNGALTPGGGNYQLGGGSGTLTVSSGLTSPGAGLVVNGNSSSGTVILTGNHTYTNATIIKGGTLMVAGLLSGPVVVESGGTLSVGVATSTISTLTVNNSVVLGGASVFAINRAGAQKADLLVANSLVLDGTLIVTNVGAAPPVLNDTFQLFSVAGTFSNALPVLNLPTLSVGLMWDVSQLSVNGTIKVAQLTNVVGDTNWPSLLAQQITSVYNSGYSNATINPGTYVMENGATTAFSFTGWNNFTINASNTLFVVDRGAQFGASCFSLINCTNVTLVGATVRSKVYPFTQGRVTAIGTNSGVLYCNWKISDGYPTNDFNWWFNAVNASNTLVNLEQGDIYYENRYGVDGSGVANNAVYLGNRTWQLKFPGWLTSFSFRTNDWLVARWSGQGFAYFFNGSTNCTFQGCTSQTGGFGTYREIGGGGNRIMDCLIEPSPEPPVGGTEPPVVACAADGVHASGLTYPGLHVENLVCQGVFLDDCVTIHGSNEGVVSSSGNTVTFDGPGKFVVGDPVRIYSSDGNYFAQANCTAIENLGNGTYKLTLDQSLSIPGGTAGENPKYSGSGYKVINCHLGNVRSRAILNKADDGLVTGCTIQNASTAMTFGPEIYWGGGGYSWNLNITNNAMLNCGRGIFFDTAGAIGNLNNTIRNNYFQDVALGRALNVNSCGNLTIDGNLFVNPAPNYNLIYLSQTTNIVLLRNFVTNQTSGLSLVGTGSGVSGLQFVANGIISAVQKRLFNQYSSLVLDGGVSPVVQNTVGSALNPVFTLQPVGNGFCVIGSGSLVLDTGNATNAGSSLQVNAYTGGDGQLWSLWPVGTTNVIVVNKLSGLAADVTSTTAGTTVIQSAINTNATDMQWYLQEVIGSTNSQSGVWVRLVGGNASGNWGTGANWQGGDIATGADAVADFTLNNITVNSIVTNETARAIGSLIFKNSTAGRFWDVDGSTNRQLTLATSSGQPSINVTNTQVFLGGFNGTQGFVKNGNGVLNLFGNTYINVVTGPILINAGSLTTANGKAFQYITGNITVATGATFGVNASFDNTTLANDIYLSGTGVGTPPGYVNSNTTIPSSPTSDVYNASTMPWGALDIYGNAELNGTITLNTDSKITHSWNFGTINGPIIATGAGKNLELRTYQSSQPDLIINGSISLGTGALTITGIGNQGVRLNNSNSFSGGTYLTAGILKVGDANALGSGAGTISVGGGATLDVSGLGSTFVLGASQTLSNSASGTGIINGSLDASSGMVSVTYNNGTPALTISSGTLTLSAATAFTINNIGTALAPGTYPVFSTSGAGVVGGVSPASVSVLGGGLSGGVIASLQISGDTLNLVVVPVAPAPTILPVYSDGLGNLVIRSETTAGHDYLLQSTTNLAPPVIWITNSTTAGTGGIITNTVSVTSTSLNRFFRYLVQ